MSLVFQRNFQLIRRRIGALREKQLRAVLTALFISWIILDGHVFHLSGGIAHSTYDWMVRHRIHASPPDSRILIVDIDEASLARMAEEFGRWPWPRDTMATLLTDIERQHPAAIVWDMLFSDPDHLNPGGDSAFDQAVQLSTHSHFAVVRLPAANDSKSLLTADALPSLWASKGITPQTTVALIPPFLDSIASARLGLSNAYPDSDGVIRRYRPVERLQDGSLLQSLPLSVLQVLDNIKWQRAIERAVTKPDVRDDLVVWRDMAGRYPRIPFYRVFEAAEAGEKLFHDKLVIVGASAPTLHDSHPTALSDRQNGVDMLATLLDNVVNERQLYEVPQWVETSIAIVLVGLLGLRMRLHYLGIVNRALIGVPLLLLAISYLSLQTESLYLDLHLAAGWIAGFLALLRIWAGIRMEYWQNMAEVAPGTGLSLLAIHSAEAWSEQAKGALIEQLVLKAPACRVFFMACADNPSIWPRAAELAALVGPESQISTLSAALTEVVECMQCTIVSLPESESTTGWLGHALVAWRKLIELIPDQRHI